MSLFGNNTNQNSGGGGLFGSNPTQNNNTGGGLFGSSTNQGGSGGGGGLFGSSTNQANKPASGGLFGSSTTPNNTGTGGGLFGSSTTPNNTGTGGGLFGSNNAPNNTGTGGGLFGSSTTQNNPSTGGGLFGSNTTQNNTGTGGGLFGSGTTQNNAGTGGGLFGASTTQPSGGGGGLFGSSTTQNQGNTGGGLFGSSTNQNTNTTSGALFGSSTNQNTAGTGGGLFGSSTNQNTGGSSLFGGNQNNANTQQNNTSSLFGGSLLGASNSQPLQSMLQNPSQQSTQQFNTSAFNPTTVTIGNHTLTQAQLQRLQFSGNSTTPNEKSVAEQLATVANKWNPDNIPVTTTLKTYLYNAVPKEYAPFFYPNPQIGEDEKSWEEALSQKPEPPKISGQDTATIAYVPTLCKGFQALGKRVEAQAITITQMRARLHEMSSSLSAVMEAHQQRITVKIESVKRQHQLLSQRCLKLVVKVQVMRNRGYALDAAEENLRRTLLSLEKQVMNPSFAGREDEIWARMVALRERARWLEEEGKKVSAQVNEQNKQPAGSAAGVPEHVLTKTRKILKDYDGQLQHLNKELEEVKKEFMEWEDSQRQRGR